jgi:hypothetical protein
MRRGLRVLVLWIVGMSVLVWLPVYPQSISGHEIVMGGAERPISTWSLGSLPDLAQRVQHGWVSPLNGAFDLVLAVGTASALAALCEVLTTLFLRRRAGGRADSPP